MKRRYFFLSLLIFNFQFSFFNCVLAQDENAAFYIYQNDGHFDGFFYDEVLKMSYSKTDTAGIEYDVFVTQEIVTADSTYRIMLSAIDSVSFVQPEIIFNPRMKVLEDGEMFQYCIGSDGSRLAFKNLPDALKPSIGDILVSYPNYKFPEGFGGKVIGITPYSTYLYVNTEPLTDFSDIFHQFVTVEDYGYNPSVQQMEVRRMAGMKMPRRRADTYSGTLFRFSANPHANWVNGPFSVTADLNVGMECRAKAVWNFSFWGEKYFKIDMKEKVETGVSTTFDIQVKTPWEDEYSLSSVAPIYLPAAAPVLQCKLLPGIFFRSQIHTTAQASTRKMTFRAGQSLEFKNWSFAGSSMSFGEQAKFDDEDEEDSGPVFQFTGSISGFAQFGVKWPFIIRTNEFFKKVLDAEVGMNIWAGPKVSGELNFNANNWAYDALTGSQGIIYNSFKDSKISFYPNVIDYELKCLVNYLSHTGDTVTILDGSLDRYSYDYFLFPNFSAPEVFFTNGEGNYTTVKRSLGYDQNRIAAFIKPSRDVMMGTRIGAALYNKKDSLLEIKSAIDGTELYYSDKTFDKNIHKWDTYGEEYKNARIAEDPIDGKATVYFGGLLPGEYKVRPLINLFDKAIVASPVTEFCIPGLYFNDIEKKFTINSSDTAEVLIPLETNAGNVKFQNDSRFEYDFLSNPGQFHHSSFRGRENSNKVLEGLPADTLRIFVTPNPLAIDLESECKLEASGYNSLGEPDTLVQTSTITRKAFNVYDRFEWSFNQNLKCTSGPDKDRFLNLSFGSWIYDCISTRQGEVISGSGNTEFDGKGLTYSFTVTPGKKLHSAHFEVKSLRDSSTHWWILSFDVSDIAAETEDYQGSGYYFNTFIGQVHNVTYTEHGVAGVPGVNQEEYTNIYREDTEGGLVANPFRVSFYEKDLK